MGQLFLIRGSHFPGAFQTLLQNPHQRIVVYQLHAQILRLQHDLGPLVGKTVINRTVVAFGHPAFIDIHRREVEALARLEVHTLTGRIAYHPEITEAELRVFRHVAGMVAPQVGFHLLARGFQQRAVLVDSRQNFRIVGRMQDRQVLIRSSLFYIQRRHSVRFARRSLRLEFLPLDFLRSELLRLSRHRPETQREQAKRQNRLHNRVPRTEPARTQLGFMPNHARMQHLRIIITGIPFHFMGFHILFPRTLPEPFVQGRDHKNIQQSGGNQTS